MDGKTAAAWAGVTLAAGAVGVMLWGQVGRPPVGRYQAVPCISGSPDLGGIRPGPLSTLGTRGVYIIDTATGRVWLKRGAEEAADWGPPADPPDASGN